MRVATYNLDGGSFEHQEALTDILTAIGADFVGLTEANDPALIASLAERLTYHHIWAKGSGDRHVAALSRFPIRAWCIHNTPPLTQAALQTELELDSTSLERRRLTIFTVHFLPYLLLPFEIRRWQAVGKLLSVIKGQELGRHLLIGDFNSIAPGDRVLQHRNPARMKRLMMLQARIIFRFAIRRLIRAGYVDSYRHLHPSQDGFTWWTVNPTTRYDYVFAPRALAPALRSAQVVTQPGPVESVSDHFPLMVDFALPLAEPTATEEEWRPNNTECG